MLSCNRMSVFFVVTDVYALFEIPSKKKRSQLYKIGVVGGWGVQRPFIKFIKKIPSVTGERLLLLAFQIFPLAVSENFLDSLASLAFKLSVSQ